ncbi:MAG: hypothetical protein KGI37_11115, partial [Alphaproteobacteria bacterium]|nr:hypothetical protein [Alphaproteobacteria bacterium]
KQAPVTFSFGKTTGELVRQNFLKSYAQVASSDSPRVAPAVAPVVSPNSAGLRPTPCQKKKSNTHGLKLRDGEIDLIRAKAASLNMSVNAYIRAKALGDDYIERPPEWMRDVLLKLYVELAAQGNNLNQLTRNVNKGILNAEIALATADRNRAPLFKTMEALQLALAGRRPPHDY